MKLIIDIPEENYKEMCEYGNERVDFDLKRMIQNGTPIPDNATNGDMIKAMFPNSVVLTDVLSEIVEFETEDDGCEMRCTVDWWNAPYQKGGNSEYLGGELYLGEFENR